MKPPFALVLVIATLNACSDRGTPASAFRDWKDQLVTAVGLGPLVWPCYVKMKDKYGVSYGRIPLDPCYKMDPPQRWRGVWRNEFEGSRFCPAPAKKCSYYSPGDRIWLDANKHPDQTVYAVDFIGRRTAVKGSYGHMGGFDYELILDRMISMRQVELPTKGYARE